MPDADRSAPHVLRRPVEAALGGAAGAVAGVVLVVLLSRQGMMADEALSVSGELPGLVPQLVVAVTAGAAFGAVFRYQPSGAAASLSSGLLLGLLAWIGWTLTLVPVLDGRSPTWSAADARTAFSSLVGSLLYGALTASLFHLLARHWAAAHPPRGSNRRRPPPTRVVVVGGGFAGVSAVQRLERLFPEDGTLDLTLVSRSNFLLFTPMLAEVASGALQPPHISTPLRAACRYTRVRGGPCRPSTSTPACWSCHPPPTGPWRAWRSITSSWPSVRCRASRTCRAWPSTPSPWPRSRTPPSCAATCWRCWSAPTWSLTLTRGARC
jgi:hypothetical protein